MMRTKERNDAGGTWVGGRRGLQRHDIASNMRHGGWVLPRALAITVGSASRQHSIRQGGRPRVYVVHVIQIRARRASETLIL